MHMNTLFEDLMFACDDVKHRDEHWTSYGNCTFLENITCLL